MKKLTKMIIAAMAAALVFSLCACGAPDKMSAEEQIERSIQNNLDALDAEYEKEQESIKEAESKEAESESIAMEEAKEAVTDYTAANLSLEDIDPVATGAGDVIGFDFSTFPETNGSFTYTWDYSSYDDTPKMSSASGTEYDATVWYQLKMVSDGKVYKDFKNAVIEWLKGQPNLIATSTYVEEDPMDSYGSAFYWTAADRAVQVKYKDGNITFKVFFLKTYTFQAAFSGAYGPFAGGEGIDSLDFHFTENVDNRAEGSYYAVGSFIPETEDESRFGSGVRAVNGYDLDSLIDIDCDGLEEGDSITITVVAVNLETVSQMTRGEDYLQISIRKN